MKDPIAIKVAVERIQSGEDPETVVGFIYNLGYTDGMLTMASEAADELRDLLDKTP